MSDEAALQAEAQQFRDDLNAARAQVAEVIVGQQNVVEGVLTAIIAGGNVLLEGVPGLGKTELVKTLARVLDLDFRRIQFTPDLMPADIVGTNIMTADPNPLDTFVYTLVAGAGAADNGMVAITGDKLVVAIPPNMAADDTLNVRVRSTDAQGGWIEQAFALPVVGPPQIVEDPLGADVFEGAAVELQAAGSGKEPLAYQWRKNGLEIPGATGRFYLIESATVADAGAYTLAISNEQGQAVSSNAAVLVRPVSYDAWVTQQSPPAGRPIYADEDYNGDGIVNLLDFAFSGVLGDPEAHAHQPVLGRDASGLFYSWREPKGPRPSYLLLGSQDLVAWPEYVPPQGSLLRIDRGTYEEVQVRVPQGSPPGTLPKWFFKLLISMPEGE